MGMASGQIGGMSMQQQQVRNMCVMLVNRLICYR